VGVPRINANDRQAQALELMPKPTGHHSAFKAYALHRWRVPTYDFGKRSWIGGSPALEEDIPRLVDDAH
jgi:hypothetical protein